MMTELAALVWMKLLYGAEVESLDYTNYQTDVEAMVTDVVTHNRQFQSLSGDYNNEGVVDLADYTMWQNNLGVPAGTLLNDTSGGVIDVDQYLAWKDKFGASMPSSLLAQNSVPEPSTRTILALSIGVSLGVAKDAPTAADSARSNCPR